MPAGKFFFFVPPLDRVIEKRKEISRSRRLVVPFLLFSRVAARRSNLEKALVKKKPDLGAAEAGKMGGEEEILARGSFFFFTSRLTSPSRVLLGFLNLNRFQNKKTLKTQTQQPTSPAWSSSASIRTRGSSCPPREEQQARRATTTTTITSSSRTR